MDQFLFFFLVDEPDTTEEKLSENGNMDQGNCHSVTGALGQGPACYIFGERT